MIQKRTGGLDRITRHRGYVDREAKKKHGSARLVFAGFLS